MIEDRLEVQGPIRGYLYAGRSGVKDDVLYKTYATQKWYYQARRINTQDNAGGGALQTRISVAAGQVAELIHAYVVGTASAGATLLSSILDEDAAQGPRLINIAAAASSQASLPSIGTAANTGNNLANSQRVLLGPGQYLVFYSSAALQTETQTIFIAMMLYNLPTLPTWDTTGSAGTPNLAASTISDANTLQEVVC